MAQDKTTYIAKVRTALSGPEDAIMKKLDEPRLYEDGNVGDVIAYAIDRKRVSQSELPAARSIQSEMARQYTISVNGNTVKPEDSVKGLFVEETYKGVKYNALDIEVASVQEGGLVYLL